MTRRRPALVATGLVVAGLLAGCSAGDGGPTPSSATSSAPGPPNDRAPSATATSAVGSPRTPPPISPRTTLSFPPGSNLPEVSSPPARPGTPIPIPSVPQG